MVTRGEIQLELLVYKEPSRFFLDNNCLLYTIVHIFAKILFQGEIIHAAWWENLIWLCVRVIKYWMIYFAVI